MMKLDSRNRPGDRLYEKAVVDRINWRCPPGGLCRYSCRNRIPTRQSCQFNGGSFSSECSTCNHVSITAAAGASSQRGSRSVAACPPQLDSCNNSASAAAPGQCRATRSVFPRRRWASGRVRCPRASRPTAATPSVARTAFRHLSAPCWGDSSTCTAATADQGACGSKYLGCGCGSGESGASNYYQWGGAGGEPGEYYCASAK